MEERTEIFKKKCREATKSALRSGKIVRTRCKVCGSFPVYCHHKDYSNPLDVTWLCLRHHLEIHGKEKRWGIHDSMLTVTLDPLRKAILKKSAHREETTVAGLLRRWIDAGCPVPEKNEEVKP
jgi:hypothetical protein